MFRNGDLSHLERDIATVAHDLRADLDQLVFEARQRPIFDRLGRRRDGAANSSATLVTFCGISPHLGAVWNISAACAALGPATIIISLSLRSPARAPSDRRAAAASRQRSRRVRTQAVRGGSAAWLNSRANLMFFGGGAACRANERASGGDRIAVSRLAPGRRDMENAATNGVRLKA